MNGKVEEEKKERWLEKIPNALASLLIIIVFATILTYIIPAGQYDREQVDGRMRAIPDTYHRIEQSPVGIFDMLKSLPIGFKGVSSIIFIVFASTAMFGVFHKSNALENAVGTFIKKLGIERRYIIVAIVTILYGMLGVFVGYENNIALTPIAVLISLAIGGDLMLAAGMAVGGITVGFGLSPINPYTVGIGHKIAEMQIFSGYAFRTIILLIILSLLIYYNIRYFKSILADRSKSLSYGISIEGMEMSKDLNEYTLKAREISILLVFLAGIITMLFGVFKHGWYIDEISTVFLFVTIISGFLSRMSINTLTKTMLESLGPSAQAAFLIGTAQAIRVILESGLIIDTIAHSFVQVLGSLPAMLSAVFMIVAQSITNIFIPSGSGQALATLPVLIPVGDLIGITRQTTISAFQFGDGITNLITPTLGGLIAMLSICKIPFGKWLAYILPFAGLAYLASILAIIVAVLINFGPV